MRSAALSQRSALSLAYGGGLVYGAPGLPPQGTPPPRDHPGAPGGPQGPPSQQGGLNPSSRELSSVPPELTASRQSLRLAVGNPGEFFVDVM